MRVELGDLGGERVVVGGQFARGLEVAAGGFELAVGGDDGRELREPAAGLAGGAGVGVQFGIGQLTLEVGVLGEHRVDRRCRFGHHASSGTPSTEVP